MPEINIESEIDVEGVDDTTNFSDSEQIPVDHINFEFEQANKLRGLFRQITIFNDTHCYQSIKNKHQRKYKYRIDISFLDPRPFRKRYVAWKWLYASGALLVLDIALVAGGWLNNLSVNSLGLFVGVTMVAVMCLLAFFYYSHDKVFFRSQYGKIRLIELINRNPDTESFRRFINRFVMQIQKSKTAKNYNTAKFLTRELQELRRLKDETIVPVESYEKAKQLIFKNKAFKSAQ